MSHQLLWESDNENLATSFTLSSDDYDYLLVITNLSTVTFTKKGKPINLYCYSRPNGCLGGAVGSWITSDNLTYNVYSCLYDFFNSNDSNHIVGAGGYVVWPTLVFGVKVKR